MSMKKYSYHRNNSACISFKSGKSPALSFKIDSGASKTILPKKLFKHFKPNATLENDREVKLLSASGHTFVGYEHTIFVVFEGTYKTSIKAIFCETEKYLLGLDSIRERFNSIVFNKDDFTVKFC